MTKQFFLVLSFFFFYNNINAQRGQALYLEFLGTGLTYSINYDVRLSNTDTGFGLRVGVGYVKFEDSNLGIPIQVNYLLGESKHKLEIGAGIANFYQSENTESEWFTFPSGVLMYRYQSEGRGLVFRAGWSPIFAPGNDGDIISSKIFWAWPGLALGYKF